MRVLYDHYIRVLQPPELNLQHITLDSCRYGTRDCVIATWRPIGNGRAHMMNIKTVQVPRNPLNYTI